MYNFGENDVFDQWVNNPRGSRLRDIQTERARILFRTERNENPTEQEVNALHTKYCRALIDLFEQHKSLHDIPKDVHLNIY
ncbi:unnamed protein product [Nippostrongylus brasiliensis]|uniref:FERM domain-containing protein n=1 Tax=Nippostrongylus brasiliensis TaxID=27835 RepID=A0A0N4XFC4_NIPBR|nr:unnamed protein product [Nippostrongylus brasiliensis]